MLNFYVCIMRKHDVWTVSDNVIASCGAGNYFHAFEFIDDISMEQLKSIIHQSPVSFGSKDIYFIIEKTLITKLTG